MCDGLLLLRSDDLALALQTSDDSVNGIQEVLAVDFLVVVPCSSQSSLIADIRNVGPGESRSVFRKEFHIKIRCKLQSPDVDLENLLPLLQIREIDVNLPVETACTKKGLVEDIGAVSGRKNDHT